MTEIKPCPFCGWDKARIYNKYLTYRVHYIEDYRLTTEKKRFYVRCNRCFAHGGSVTGQIVKSFAKFRLNFNPSWIGDDKLFVDDYDNPLEETVKPELPSWAKTKVEMEEQAITLWNRRVTDDV